MWYLVHATFKVLLELTAPTKFGTKVVIVTYSPYPSCVPNFKLPALMVAEISRRSQNIWDSPLVQTPPILVLNVVSW